jgi:hypothetical protein
METQGLMKGAKAYLSTTNENRNPCLRGTYLHCKKSK